MSGTPTNPANQLPMRIKKDASPWWWLIQNHAENRNVAFYLTYPQGASASTFGNNLTPADWSPGTQRLDEAGGKAFIDPHHRYQAYPVAQKMNQLGITVRAVWGAYNNGNGSNAAGGDYNSWNVGQDVIDANAGSVKEDVVLTLRDRWLIGQVASP